MPLVTPTLFTLLDLFWAPKSTFKAFGTFGRPTGHYELKMGQKHLFGYDNWSNIMFSTHLCPCFGPTMSHFQGFWGHLDALISAPQTAKERFWKNDSFCAGTLMDPRF